MPRPKLTVVCAKPGCPEKAGPSGKCGPHTPKPWAGHRSPLQGGRWARLRAKVWKRDHGLCQTIVPGRGRCLGPGAFVDHKIPRAEGGETWDEANLAVICDPHHREKSAAEAARGRARGRARRLAELGEA